MNVHLFPFPHLHEPADAWSDGTEPRCCAGCGLVDGHGWYKPGTAEVCPDPLLSPRAGDHGDEPDDGLVVAGAWCCSEECGDFYRDRHVCPACRCVGADRLGDDRHGCAFCGATWCADDPDGTLCEVERPALSAGWCA